MKNFATMLFLSVLAVDALYSLARRATRDEIHI